MRSTSLVRFAPRHLRAAIASAATLCLTAPAAIARAQPASAPPPRADAAQAARVLSLVEALAYARAHQPAIRASMARVAAQEEAAKIPRSQWLPSVGATAQIFAATTNNTTGTYVGAPYVDIPRIGGTKVVSGGSMQPYPATFAGVGVQQEIFDFGRIAAQSAAADAVVDVTRQQAAVDRLNVDFSVEEAYFAVYAAKSVVRASEEAYERAKVHRDLAKAGVDSGLRPPVELTRAEADLTRFDIGRERARAGLTVAQTLLAAAVGVPDTQLDVTDAPPSVRDVPSLSAAVREAAERDPRIRAAEARLRAQEQLTRSIGAELRPNLALSSTLSVRAGGATPSGNGQPAHLGGWAPDVPNWDVGLVLTWPIFSGTVHARERASRASEAVQREELAAARYQQQTGIQQAYVDLEVSRAALPALERAVEAARANYAQAEARFKSGLGSSVELADAEALRTQAEIDLALGQFAVARARAAFGRTIAEEF